ncbi:hypothetical protein [Alicyclobacillus suci]|uniref:hypothetical protein n=1 Tax=Alicyclobacillus suci TaxID=2816080 RepID=UPI001A8DB150|nr:hypothetical protein [Alicyclobacillus suci]
MDYQLIFRGNAVATVKGADRIPERGEKVLLRSNPAFVDSDSYTVDSIVTFVNNSQANTQVHIKK